MVCQDSVLSSVREDVEFSWRYPEEVEELMMTSCLLSGAADIQQ